MHENKEKSYIVCHDIAMVIKKAENMVTERTLEDISDDIKACKNQIKQDFIKLGTLLNEAKEVYGTYGNWGAWLKGNFDLSQSTATRHMNIASEFLNSSTLHNLGLSRTKADALIQLDEHDRKDFIQNHDIENMSTRKLVKCVREYKGIETKKPKEVLPPNRTMNLNSISDVQMYIDNLRESITELTEHFLKNSSNKEMWDISIELKNLCSE